MQGSKKWYRTACLKIPSVEEIPTAKKTLIREAPQIKWLVFTHYERQLKRFIEQTNVWIPILIVKQSCMSALTTVIINCFKWNSITAWKVSKYGVISGPYFPVFGLKTGKYGPETTPYLDTFHAVVVLILLRSILVIDL